MVGCFCCSRGSSQSVTEGVDRNFVLRLICKGVDCIMSPHRGFLASALSVLACLAWPSPSFSGPIAHLTLQSQPGSFIGAGENWDVTYTPQNSQSFFVEINQTLPNGQPDYISFIMGTVTSNLNTNTYADLEFSTVQLGTPLQPGTYNNAERAAFATPGHPGLDVGFQNRGSNVLTGSFTINELSFFRDQSNNLQIGSFSVSFAQSSDHNTSNITGTFTFQAAVPEPSSLVMLSLGTIALAGGYSWSRIKRSALRSRDGGA
jgi:PEP-CTERM motif